MSRQNKLYLTIIAVASGIILLSVSAALIGFNDVVTMEIQKGERYFEQGDYDRALLAYQRAIDKNDADAEAYLGMVRVYEKTGDRELLLKTLQTGLEKTGDPRIRAMLSIYLTQEEAVAAQDLAASEEPVPERKKEKPEQEKEEQEEEEEAESDVFSGDAGAVSFSYPADKEEFSESDDEPSMGRAPTGEKYWIALRDGSWKWLLCFDLDVPEESLRIVWDSSTLFVEADGDLAGNIECHGYFQEEPGKWTDPVIDGIYRWSEVIEIYASNLDIETADGEIRVQKSRRSEEELMEMIGMQGGE